MDDGVPDRTIRRLRLDPKSLGEIVDILRRNDRRAVVKLDDVKIDDPDHADAARLAAAKSIDIVSYWVHPDRPTFGRRHFVYLASGPAGAQYFGDSMSPEVTRVLKDLDVYFGRHHEPPTSTTATALAPAADGVAAAPLPVTPPGGLSFGDRKVMSIVAVIALLTGAAGFMLGRATAPENIVYMRPDPPKSTTEPGSTDPATTEPTSGPATVPGTP